jgi:hypothetical protein
LLISWCANEERLYIIIEIIKLGFCNTYKN